jgi:hypothetical protein
MAIQIDLNPQIEAELKAQAQRNGLPLSQYVQRILEEHVPGQPVKSNKTPAERAKAFQDWSLSFPRHRTTPLPDDAISREAIYQPDNE